MNLIRKAMERVISMTKWGRTFIDYGLYASYLAARQARHDQGNETPISSPNIAKTVYPDGRTVHHVKQRP
jgi:hypothetical protein